MRRSALAAAAVLAALAPSAAGSPAPPVQAQAYLVTSGLDGGVLAARAASQRRSIASITKLMTVLVALGHARLDEAVTGPPQAAGIGESTIFLRAGDRVTVRELALGALVPSANDAATALAIHVGGSAERFVAMMNAKARSLGLRDTHFANPHGLDQAGHVSSARDVVTLLRAALRDPFVRKAARLPEVTIRGRVFEATNDLAGVFLPLVGGKTGHTSQAGWSEVAAAREPGVVVYAAVLGSPTREQRNADLEALLRFGLDEYHPIAAVSSTRTYALARTAYGRADVRLVAPRTIVRAARVDRPLLERVVAPTAVALPVAQGQSLGEVRVYDGSRLVASSPLVAANAVAEPGTVGKAGWYARRTIHHLAGLVS
ncbi:MAG TPA: D-alanyl-D-alanine carboxypeptidase family protein [Gaiellaceae bacterium]|nr:D-alanyl-D-alanine carboxypeptidase family protein [Gaiellaceae bacterium]